MSAYWHDDGTPSFLGGVLSYSFVDTPEIHAEAPSPYMAAMEDLRIREALLGFDADWHKHNAEQAHQAYVRKKPWWL